MNNTPRRLTYLKPGEATIGMAVHLERAHNRLLSGQVTAIEERPTHQKRLARRCSIQLNKVRTVHEYEDRLLI